MAYLNSSDSNPTTIRCGNCRKTFRAQRAGPGLVVTCPRCGKKNRIPQGLGAAAATSEEARPLGEYNSRAIPQPIGAPGERNSRVIPQDVKIQVSARDQGRCVQCGSTQDLHYDHKIPWSRGGSNSVNNIQLMCGPCNRAKGARLIEGVGTVHAGSEPPELERAPQFGTTLPVPARAPQWTPMPTESPVGATFRHIDMVMTLLEARSTFAVPKKQYYGRRQAEDLLAGDGAKFVTVRTEVLNDAPRSICLTCALPMLAYVFDDRGRQFDSIGSLYKIAGNPECSDHLQPGFTSQMTWVYRVPVSANIVAFEFEDISDFGRDRTVPPTRIPLVIADL